NGISCWTAFRQNPKKRGAKAGADGIFTKLFVQKPDQSGRDLNFTSVGVDEHLTIFRQVAAILGEHRFGNMDHFKASE
ncbi:MAG: hypothetical protein KDD90_12120, partial [Sphingomonadaceae bacterium]|nr:hypothetical protein [Sphingomonadaceae bacterium]